MIDLPQLVPEAKRYEIGMQLVENTFAKLDGRRPKKYATMQTYIYFIRCGDLVKIGITRNPQRRMEALQTGNAGPLEMVFLVHGDKHDEARFHARYADLRERGEWFRYEGELRAFLEAL